MLNGLVRFANTLWRRYQMGRYDDFTIAEFFRSRGACVGQDCRIQVRSLGSEPWLISIGDHCTIGSGVSFVTHDGGVWVFTEELPSLQHFGRIDVLDNCFIGVGSILMPGIRIGPNAVVGAGSVVTHDVPMNAIVAGVPARPLAALDEYKRRAVSAWAQQRPPGYLEDLHDGVRYPASHIQRRKKESMELLRQHLQQRLPRLDES